MTVILLNYIAIDLLFYMLSEYTYLYFCNTRIHPSCHIYKNNGMFFMPLTIIIQGLVVNWGSVTSISTRISNQSQIRLEKQNVSLFFYS